jgi:2-aminoethylphosphonate-pyruvate transaminase
MSRRVRRALAAPDVCHREPEFVETVGLVRGRLRAVYDEPAHAYVPVLLGGSGTAAVEAMLSLVGPHESTLVLAHGVYGERIAAMLRAQQKPHEVLGAPWTDAVDLDAVARALASGAFRRLAVVHHETTTGRLVDLAALGALATRFAVPMLVDAVSSFGAEELRLAAWNVEAAAGVANKCLHGAPGVSFVLARADALLRPSGATSLTLDLHRHAAAQERGDMAFTLPTHVTHALAEALDEHAERGGWEARRATYAARSAVVRAAALRAGASLLLGDARAYASALTSFRLPPGASYDALHASLKRAGFVIYRGQGALDGRIFRIAVMGDLDGRDLERLAAALGHALG